MPQALPHTERPSVACSCDNSDQRALRRIVQCCTACLFTGPRAACRAACSDIAADVGSEDAHGHRRRLLSAQPHDDHDEHEDDEDHEDHDSRDADEEDAHDDEEHGGGEDHAEHAAEHARAGADSVLDEHSLESLASGNTPGALKALLAYAHVCLACFTVAASAGLQHSTQQRRFGQDHVDAETWGARCLAAI